MSLNVNEELYRSVRMVLGDSDNEFSKLLSSTLFPIGLRDIAICTNGQQLRDAIASTVDLVICDVGLPGVDFNALTQDIRHERIAGNPFIVLIATMSNPDEASIARILESGVDDLIVKPTDAATLVRRIGAFAKGRKPFVVTPGYIGPSRRAARREDGSDDEVVEVPNTIRAKVAHKQSPAEIDKLVNVGRSSLSSRMANTGIKVIARLTRKLSELQRDAAFVEQMRRALRILATKAAEVAATHRNSPAARYIAPIAERIARLSYRAETSLRPPVLEIDLLSQLSDAAQIATTSSEGAPEAVPEIVAIVDSFLKRQ